MIVAFEFTMTALDMFSPTYPVQNRIGRIAVKPGFPHLPG